MVEHLSTLVENFPGAANQTQCFTHILNLVAKSILHQFKVQKKTDGNEPDDLDDAMKALAVLAQELELEESSTELIEDPEEELEEDDEVTEDDEDGLGDERNGDRTGIRICTDIAIPAYYFCILKILCTLY